MVLQCLFGLFTVFMKLNKIALFYGRYYKECILYEKYSLTVVTVSFDPLLPGFANTRPVRWFNVTFALGDKPRRYNLWEQESIVGLSYGIFKEYTRSFVSLELLLKLNNYSTAQVFKFYHRLRTQYMKDYCRLLVTDTCL